MSPEVFCFADYPCHTVAIDILKAPPEDDNREIATWYITCSLAVMIVFLCSLVLHQHTDFVLNLSARVFCPLLVIKLKITKS